MDNKADSDQMASLEASYCFLKRIYSCSAGQGVKLYQ